MPANHRRSRLKPFLPFDTPQHVLMNFAPRFMMAGSVFLLAIALWMGYLLQGPLPFLCAYAGLYLGTWFERKRRPNIFAGGYLGGRVKPLHEIDESARRVLTFFQSPLARRLTSVMLVVYSIITTVTWYVSVTWLPKPRPVDLQSYLGFSFGAAWFSFFTSLGGHSVLFWYALRRWDWIQETFEPWPVD